MFVLHQIVNVVINPMMVGLGLLVVALWCFRCGLSQWGRRLCCAAVLGGFVAGLPVTVDTLIGWLEHDYPPIAVDSLPVVDAVVVLGGGVSAWPEGAKYPTADLHEGADRVWHGARIWQRFHREGRDLNIYFTGPDVSKSAVPFLTDLGVATNCIVALEGPRNTEEEAKRYAKALGRKRIALVTSAMHMKRSIRIFRKYAPELEVVAAATDHQAVSYPGKWTKALAWVPSIATLNGFVCAEHEILGLIRYGW